MRALLFLLFVAPAVAVPAACVPSGAECIVENDCPYGSRTDVTCESGPFELRGSELCCCPNNGVPDCNGICDGPATIDCSGTCGTKVVDCLGNCGGSAVDLGCGCNAGGYNAQGCCGSQTKDCHGAFLAYVTSVCGAARKCTAGSFGSRFSFCRCASRKARATSTGPNAYPSPTVRSGRRSFRLFSRRATTAHSSGRKCVAAPATAWWTATGFATGLTRATAQELAAEAQPSTPVARAAGAQ